MTRILNVARELAVGVRDGFTALHDQPLPPWKHKGIWWAPNSPTLSEALRLDRIKATPAARSIGRGIAWLADGLRIAFDPIIREFRK